MEVVDILRLITILTDCLESHQVYGKSQKRKIVNNRLLHFHSFNIIKIIIIVQFFKLVNVQMQVDKKRSGGKQ